MGSGRSVIFTAGGGNAAVSASGSEHSSLVTSPNSLSSNTWYSGKLVGGDSKKERIDWVVNDEILVACQECEGALKSYRYKVNKVTPDNARSIATLVQYDGGNGLQWGTGKHNFYAIYPSPATSGDPAVNLELTTAAGANTGCKVTAVIPPTQTLTMQKDTLRPDMKYAYMYATTSASPTGPVSLAFSPIVTTFQFSVKPDKDTKVSKATLYSEECALSGTFTGTVTVTGGQVKAMTYDVPVKTSENNKVTVDLSNIELAAADNLVFTILTLPASKIGSIQEKLTKMVIEFELKDATDNDYAYTKALHLKKNNAYIEFTGRKKYLISGITLPVQKFPITIKEITVGNFEQTMSDAGFGDITVEDFNPDDLGSY